MKGFSLFIGNHLYIMGSDSTRKTRKIVNDLFNLIRVERGVTPIEMSDYEYGIFKDHVQHCSWKKEITSTGREYFCVKESSTDSGLNEHPSITSVPIGEWSEFATVFKREEITNYGA